MTLHHYPARRILPLSKTLDIQVVYIAFAKNYWITINIAYISFGNLNEHRYDVMNLKHFYTDSLILHQ